MATNDTVVNTPIPELREQIGQLLTGFYYRMKHKPKKQNIVLMESFDIWNINTRRLEEAIPRGKLPAYKTRYQHHQIRLGRRSKAYATSRKTGPNSRWVFKVGLSQTAEKIDDAIDRIDADIDDTTAARLLVIRNLCIYAFWLVGRGEIYIISIPARFGRAPDDRLRAGQYLGVTEFMSLLRDKIERFKSDGNANSYRRGRRRW